MGLGHSDGVVMAKVINKDIIEKIATYAGKGYSRAETARELHLDRKTVGKYWAKEEKPEVKKEEEEPKAKLPIEQEFELLTKKKEADLELEDMGIEAEDTQGETAKLQNRREVIQDQIKLLRKKLGETESIADVDKVRELAAKVKDDVTALLAEDGPLRKQRQEQKVKKEESLMQARLDELAWVFPCRRDKARQIIDKLISSDVHGDVDSTGALNRVGLLLMMAEDLEWKDNTSDLKPLVTECANLLRGNWEEKERIMEVAYRRKKRILIPSDEDMEGEYLHLLDLLTTEGYERSVEMVFKFNTALSRLAEERFVDIEELLSKEALLPERVIG
ncbi:hypothetical protein ES703_21196 [subsurface metagenome]